MGRLSALSVFLSKSVLYGAFVWARRALSGLKWRFPARAELAALQSAGERIEINELLCDKAFKLVGAALSLAGIRI